MSGHARVSPSGAARWMKCTKAPLLEERFPAGSTSYAEEGTQAHKVAEYYARQAVGLPLLLEHNPIAKDEEMSDAADEYAAYIKETYLRIRETCPDAYIETEVRLDLTRWIPDGFGTADCLIIADDVLHVIDFKYGKGVKVEAENNQQMMIYALGALGWSEALYDVSTVRMVIIQPRLGGISDSEVSADWLRDWGEVVLKPIADLAYHGGGSFSPGEDTCRFCRASGSCKAQADYFVSLFDDNPEDDIIDPDEAGKLLQLASGMKEWLKALESKVYESLMDGEPVAGWKLVEGRSTRRYTDEAEIEKRLRAKKYKVSDIYEKKMIGITKMEKLLGKRKMQDLIGDLIEKPRGSATLAPEDDKRPSYNRDQEIADMFDD